MKHHPPSKNRFGPADSTQDNSPQGIAWLLAGMALLTVMDAIAKWLSATYPINEIVFFRSFFAFLPITLIVMLTGGRATLPTRRPGLHLLRGVLGLFTVSMFFTAISLMPLADATAVAFASPLFITTLSVVPLSLMAPPLKPEANQTPAGSVPLLPLIVSIAVVPVCDSKRYKARGTRLGATASKSA